MPDEKWCIQAASVAVDELLYLKILEPVRADAARVCIEQQLFILLCTNIRPIDTRGQAAMTVNQRLWSAGLLGAFDHAVREGNRCEIIRILGLVDLAEQADRIADRILARSPPDWRP